MKTAKWGIENGKIQKILLLLLGKNPHTLQHLISHLSISPPFRTQSYSQLLA